MSKLKVFTTLNSHLKFMFKLGGREPCIDAENILTSFFPVVAVLATMFYFLVLMTTTFIIYITRIFLQFIITENSLRIKHGRGRDKMVGGTGGR